MNQRGMGVSTAVQDAAVLAGVACKRTRNGYGTNITHITGIYMHRDVYRGSNAAYMNMCMHTHTHTHTKAKRVRACVLSPVYNLGASLHPFRV